MQRATLAIPGRDTTAYLLYRLLLPEAKVERFCRYEEIPKLLMKWSDYGLLIHETRSPECLKKAGLYEVCDLGKMWEDKTGLPLPLGCLVAKRELGKATLTKLSDSITASLDYGQRHPTQTYPYILEHSQEKDPQVVQSHIDLYINDETRKLSQNGQAAIQLLLQEAQKAKLLPDLTLSHIFY